MSVHSKSALNWVTPAQKVFLIILIGLVGALLTQGTSQVGHLDNYIYLAYSIDFEYLLLKFGPTYYSRRIVHIFPQAIIQDLFGLGAGFFVHKFIQTSTVFVFFFKTLNLFKSEIKSFIGSIAFVFSPIFLTSIGSDHYDGSVLVYQVILLYLLVKSWKTNLLSNIDAFLIGLLSACLINGNIWAFGITMIAAAFTLSNLAIKQTSFHCLCKLLAVSLIGLASGYAILLVLFNCSAYFQEQKTCFPNGMVFDVFNILPLVQLSTTSISNWATKSLHHLLHGTFQFYFLIIPIFATLVYVLLRRSEKRNIFDINSVFGLLYVLQFFAYLMFETAFDASVLGLYYYIPYLYPAFFLALTCLLLPDDDQSLLRNVTVIPILFASLLCYWNNALEALPSLAQYLPYKISLHYNDSVVGGWVLALFFASTSIILLSRALTLQHVLLIKVHRMMLASVFGLSVFTFEYNNYHYFNRNHVGKEVTVEKDHRSASFDLISLVKKHVKPRDKVGFLYYSDNKPPVLDSIQSTFLWGYSKFGSGTYSITREDLADLRSQYMDTIVVMGNIENIAESISSLEVLSVPYQKLELKTFQYPSFDFDVQVLRISHN